MLADDRMDPFEGREGTGATWMTGDENRVAHDGGADQVTAPALDPAIFSLLLGRIEQLSRELGRAETQRTLVEQHIARLEQQIEKLSRQQDTVS